MLEMPVSATHLMQVTGKDEYILIVSVNLQGTLIHFNK